MSLSFGLVTGGLAFDGKSLEREGLGGSETAFLCMARELAKRGHKVRVFCNTENPGLYDGVEYFHISNFGQFLPIQTFDVLISSRWPEFLTIPSRAGLRILWCHDTLQDKSRLMSMAHQTDEYWLLSDFHIENYCGTEVAEERNPKAPDIKPHIWKTSNGVDVDLVAANLRPKEKGKCIYTSRPERGLVNLIRDIFPRMVKERPDLKLYFAHYDLKGMRVPDHVTEAVKFCNDAAKNFPDNIVKLGHLTKAELYQHVSSAEIQLYPCVFDEISCIAALEAQACGTPIVTTDNWALSETVINRETGVLIKGNPNDASYQEEFASKALRVLSKEFVRAKMAKAGPESILKRGLSWAQVAESWETHVLAVMAKRYEENRVNVVKRLVHCGDLASAVALEPVGNPDLDALLKMELEAAAYSFDGMLDPATMGQRYEKAIPTFARALEVFAGCTKTKPVEVLDYLSGEVSLGLFLAPKLPDAVVTIVARNESVYDCLSAYLKLRPMKNVTLVAKPEELWGELNPHKVFDLVLLNEILDRARHPVQILEEVGLLSHSTTNVLGITRYGARGNTLKDPSPDLVRYHNFDFEDFKDFFPLAEQEVQAAFVPGESPHVGNWIFFAGLKATEPYTISLDASLERRKRRTRPYQSIGLGMIVKNEEDHLSRCLKAVAPYVDEIVIVDSGSTDDTLRIAEFFNAEVIFNEFDNFGAQRNISKAALKKHDWFLWLDADEVLMGGEKIRSACDSVVFNGYVIRQHQLQYDVPGTYDKPIRLLRNKNCYKFNGLIHEHCEDVSVKPFDESIMPAIILDTVNIAHYGYPSEAVRRKKCSGRNMRFLVRDLKEQPERELNWLLFIRDCLNIVKWRASGKRGIARNSLEHSLLNAAVATYFKKFADPKCRHYESVDPMYQEALKILAAAQLPFETRQAAPFEIELGLRGQGGGGVDKDKRVTPSTRWFIDDEQMQDYMNFKLAELAVAMGGPLEKYDAVLKKGRGTAKFFTDLDSAVDLLEVGVDMFK